MASPQDRRPLGRRPVRGSPDSCRCVAPLIGRGRIRRSRPERGGQLTRNFTSSWS